MRSATLPPSLVRLIDLRRQSKLTRNMRLIVEYITITELKKIPYTSKLIYYESTNIYVESK